jgi:hypothetical protein
MEPQDAWTPDLQHPLIGKPIGKKRKWMQIALQLFTFAILALVIRTNWKLQDQVA